MSGAFPIGKVCQITDETSETTCQLCRATRSRCLRALFSSISWGVHWMIKWVIPWDASRLGKSALMGLIINMFRWVFLFHWIMSFMHQKLLWTIDKNCQWKWGTSWSTLNQHGSMCAFPLYAQTHQYFHGWLLGTSICRIIQAPSAQFQGKTRSFVSKW